MLSMSTARVRSSTPRRPAQVNALSPWLLLTMIGCHGGGSSTISPGDGSAPSAPQTPQMSAQASAPSAVAGPSPLPSLTPTVPVGELTSPVPNSPLALREAVSSLTRKIAEYGGQVGVAVVDVHSGDLLAAQNDRRPLNPASNAKLFTAATALATLKGNYRFETGLYGEQKGASVARLVLRGQGDPSLVTRDLWDMVQDLRDQGVRRVEGDILVDQHFSTRLLSLPRSSSSPTNGPTFGRRSAPWPSTKTRSR
jgi:D-alanyl-D-alanine carboxypeptidase/D-alanyl-D-alanine-endopeptidase (penicillin-binding protein 4)